MLIWYTVISWSKQISPWPRKEPHSFRGCMKCPTLFCAFHIPIRSSWSKYGHILRNISLKNWKFRDSGTVSIWQLQKEEYQPGTAEKFTPKKLYASLARWTKSSPSLTNAEGPPAMICVQVNRSWVRMRYTLSDKSWITDGIQSSTIVTEWDVKINSTQLIADETIDWS